MSRIGKKAIDIPDGVKVEVSGKTVKVAGPKGNLQIECELPISVKVDTAAKQITVENE
ncbi:MAG: 50S ribosomal protein L6, partial [Planctomycetes bacterium]|nr:50S ribosomal protein L6 [Planctomycetota bacterium]